ncbi:MAG: acyl-CoA dehydrogenase family protein, partial [Bradyrhizobium sp.]
AYGGEGASVSQVAEVCYILGQTCASTAMIFAMHQVKAACLINHASGRAAMEDFMRQLVAEQLLIASSTTEGNNGGNVRSSEGAVERNGDRFTLDRHASCISYGQPADALMTTARRDPSAANSDQVLVVVRKNDYTLTPTGGWDTLGMRGTVSIGFQLHVDAACDKIMSVPYATIHTQSMVPTAHIFWTCVWAGIAAAALEKSRRFVRMASRKSGGNLPPGAVHMARATSSLTTLRALISQTAARYEALANDPDSINSIEFQNEILMLKVEGSELAQNIVLAAMRAGGLSAYRLDGEFAIGRHLRDIMAAPVMIHNDRIVGGAVASSMMREVPRRLAAYA